MNANFFNYSMYDRFIPRQPCVRVRASVNFFTKKKKKKKKRFPSETIDWILTKFHRNNP